MLSLESTVTDFIALDEFPSIAESKGVDIVADDIKRPGIDVPIKIIAKIVAIILTVLLILSPSKINSLPLSYIIIHINYITKLK
jgi:hypothetical protein